MCWCFIIVLLFAGVLLLVPKKTLYKNVQQKMKHQMILRR